MKKQNRLAPRRQVAKKAGKIRLNKMKSDLVSLGDLCGFAR
jgi:hypothetical protein